MQAILTEEQIDAIVDALPVQQQVRMVARLFIAKPVTVERAIVRMLGGIAVMVDSVPVRHRKGLARALRSLGDHVDQPKLKAV